MQKLANMLRRSDRRSLEKVMEMPVLTDEQRAASDREAKEAARRERMRVARQRIASAHIPPLYASASLGDCHPAVAEYASEVAEGGTGWLLLTGRNGRGKTHQACAALRHLAKTHRVEFATMQGILDECKQTFGRPESEEDVKSHYRNVPVLVLDDLGKENPTDYSLPIIFDIVDRRYTRLKPTIITTNMNAAQLLAHMSMKGDRTMAESVVSRLGTARVVEITGPDRRLRNA